MRALVRRTDGLEVPGSQQGPNLNHERRLDQRERDVERREVEVASRERDLAARLELAQTLLAAAQVRGAASDALDALADQWERDLDLEQMLSRASDAVYGADWSARRHATLGREQAKADRLSALLDLTALAAAYTGCAVEGT